jgi:hypothetical protein
MNWLFIAGLVLATSGVAGAITFNQDYSGPIVLKFSNFDSARIYVGPDGTYTSNSGPDELTLADLKNNSWSQGDAYGSINPPGAQPGEDCWGLFELSTISGKDPNTGVFNVVLWEKGGANDTKADIVGMFYGVVDQQVTLHTRTDGLIEQEVWSSGANSKLDLYEVPNGSAVLQDPTARTGAGQFPGWTVGTPVLQGLMVADEITTPASPSGTKFWSRTILNPDATITSRQNALGNTKLFVEWYGGSAYPEFSAPGTDMGFFSDIYGNQTNFTWTTNSDDPAFGSYTGDNVVVPEPMTLLGLLLAAGSAGGYLKRRLSNIF